MDLLSCSVGPYDNNAYLLVDGEDAVLVDAAQDAPALLDFIAGRRISAIVTTHRHPDHIAALPELARATGARLITSAMDADAIESASGLAHERVWDGDVVRVGATELAVIGLVGHTEGGICLAYTPPDAPVQLIVGDCLFPGGPGRTTRPEEFTSLMDDLESKIFDVYGDDTVIYPGHGADTTLGKERPHLAEWRARGW